jgi:uncharacterized membrane protein
VAGIGFELKRLFSKSGLAAAIRAYGYAGIVCTGPMLLGIILLAGAMIVARMGGASVHEQELLMAMLTYTLLFSLALTSIFSMSTTRCVADMLYVKRAEKIMPTFYGSITLLLAIGVIGYGIFLWFAGISLVYRCLCLILFALLIVVWTEINYLTAIKDYRSILLAFLVSLIGALISGTGLMILFSVSPVAAMLTGICCGYGIMSVWYFILLYQYFPEGKGSMFYFLRYLEKYPQLAFIGIFLTLGLFGHLVLMWFGPSGVQIQGLFYGAPSYDIPALIAFFSILITTINFTMSVEVRFYPHYRRYFGLFNEKGSISDIMEAEGQMLTTLQQELSYLAQKQVFTTLVFVVVGTILLPYLPLGFDSTMLGTYRVLCVGYGFYAIANSLMLIQLYFADNSGAMAGTAAFALLGNLATGLLLKAPAEYSGFGFVVGGAIFLLIAWIRLERYLNKLKYHVLSRQPVFARMENGWITRFCNKLDERAARREREQGRSTGAVKAAERQEEK